MKVKLERRNGKIIRVIIVEEGDSLDMVIEELKIVHRPPYKIIIERLS